MSYLGMLCPTVGKGLGGLPSREEKADNSFKVKTSQLIPLSMSTTLYTSTPIENISACICTITVRSRTTQTKTIQVILSASYPYAVNKYAGDWWTISYFSNTFSLDLGDYTQFNGWSIHIEEYDVNTRVANIGVSRLTNNSIVSFGDDYMLNNSYIMSYITSINNVSNGGNSSGLTRLNENLIGSYVSSAQYDNTYAYVVKLNDKGSILYQVEYVTGHKGIIQIIEWSNK